MQNEQYPKPGKLILIQSHLKIVYGQRNDKSTTTLTSISSTVTIQKKSFINSPLS